MNQKQIDLMNEWFQKQTEFKEKAVWIGCNPDNPELLKQQANDGFKLMIEFSEYTKGILNQIEAAFE